MVKLSPRTNLDYAKDDVQCTWELFVKLRDLYKQHGVKKRITHIYSEASIGKAYFEELGVQSFFGYDPRLKVNTRNLNFDLRDAGASMDWRERSADTQANCRVHALRISGRNIPQ